MIQFISQHEFWAAIVGYWVFSAGVSAMPAPMPNGNPGYTWLYQFLHTIAGNLTTAFANKIPGIAKIAPLILIVFMLPSMGCAGYKVHPGAFNRVDSQAYDSLLVAESVIDQAKVQLQQGNLPDTIKPTLNKLIASYNLARDAWFSYHGLISGGPPQFNVTVTQVTQYISNMADDVKLLKVAMGGK